MGKLFLLCVLCFLCSVSFGYVSQEKAREIKGEKFISFAEWLSVHPGEKIDSLEINFTEQDLAKDPSEWLVPACVDGKLKYVLIKAYQSLKGLAINSPEIINSYTFSLNELKELLSITKLRPSFPNSSETESKLPFKLVYAYKSNELISEQRNIDFQKALMYFGSGYFLVNEVPANTMAGLISSYNLMFSSVMNKMAKEFDIILPVENPYFNNMESVPVIYLTLIRRSAPK